MENNKKTNIISQVSRFQDFMGSAEAYIKPIRTCIRTCKMELFEKIANGFQMILRCSTRFCIRPWSVCKLTIQAMQPSDYTNFRYFLSVFTQHI